MTSRRSGGSATRNSPQQSRMRQKQHSQEPQRKDSPVAGELTLSHAVLEDEPTGTGRAGALGKVLRTAQLSDPEIVVVEEEQEHGHKDADTRRKQQQQQQEEESIEEDAELEATFRELRLASTEEALAALNQDRQQRRGQAGPISSSDSSLPPPCSSGAAAPDHGNADTDANGSPKRSKRVLSQLDVSELIQMKISQLESASSVAAEEDEEKTIAKAMKKIHKEISQVVNGQEDHLGKVNFMQRKYLEMFQDMRKQERDQLKLKKKCELLQREKDLLHREKDRLQKSNDQLVAERTQLLEGRQADELSIIKSSTLCRKLEGLCRQIHRDNRRIQEEVQQRTDQISGSFEKAIVEFKDKVETDIAERQRVMDENDSVLRDKFQGFLEQYDVREKHFNSVVKSKDLELELAHAKLTRQTQLLTQQTQLLAQQTQLTAQETNRVDLLKSQLEAFAKTEAELRKQLNVYVEKFKQVEETLNKSNSLFQTFRKEMEAMSKKGAGLEKVNLAIRAKCDTMNQNILEMAEERTKHQHALDAAHKKRIKLETLCRALHAERAVLRKNLDLYEARCPALDATIAGEGEPVSTTMASGTSPPVSVPISPPTTAMSSISTLTSTSTLVTHGRVLSRSTRSTNLRIEGEGRENGGLLHFEPTPLPTPRTQWDSGGSGGSGGSTNRSSRPRVSSQPQQQQQPGAIGSNKKHNR